MSEATKRKHVAKEVLPAVTLLCFLPPTEFCEQGRSGVNQQRSGILQSLTSGLV